MNRLRLLPAALILTLLIPRPAPAGDASPAPPVIDMPVALDRPGLIEVEYSGAIDRDRLHRLDLDIIDERPGRSARLLAWPGAIEALRGAGFRIRVLEADFGAALARRNGAIPTPAAPASPATSLPVGQGSAAGYHTLAEVDAVLNDLVANDPNGIVGAVTQIGLSRQNRPIKAIRIAKESLPDHSRPRVLFTGMHHAREPMGMECLLEFMKRLVDGYGVDPDISYLVDNREIWFVPIVNPDGYQINLNSWNGSGVFGLWRKNARDNDSNGLINSQDGVDINRNYGYRWGYDNVGSSGTMSSLEYRGTLAWSEPETRAIRDFCVAHGFATADNYHSYAEVVVYPWGYNGTDTPDGPTLARMADDMARDSHYGYGNTNAMLYLTNGDADDYMYGEQGTKPKCLAVTTEVGDANDNFWPPQSKIASLAAGQFRANMVIAATAGTYVVAEQASIVSSDGFFYPGSSAGLSVTLRNAGLAATTGAVHVTAATSVPGITITDASSDFPGLAAGAIAGPTGGDLFQLSALRSVVPGSQVPIVLTLADQGTYAWRDTITVLMGKPTVAFFDDASQGTGQWTVFDRWGIQNVNGDWVYSDSPGGLYTTMATAIMTTAAPLDLSGAGRAWLTFQSTWDIDIGGDAGRVEISTDGGSTWTGVPGRYTRPGHGTTGAYSLGTQLLDEPCYDGTHRFEATEQMDLTPWAGLTDVRLRLRLTTDDSYRRDGWYVDDITVLVYPNTATGVPDEPAPAPPALSAAWPNPFRNGTRLTATFAAPTTFQAAVYSVDGRLVKPLASGFAAAGPRDLYWDGRRADGREAAAGTYYLRVDWRGGRAGRTVIKFH